jgi:hypothetical protein
MIRKMINRHRLDLRPGDLDREKRERLMKLLVVWAEPHIGVARDPARLVAHGVFTEAIDHGGRDMDGETLEALLRELGYRNDRARVGDGYAGWPGRALYDVIVLMAAPEQVPRPLLDQLRVGSRLVATANSLAANDHGAWAIGINVVC